MQSNQITGKVYQIRVEGRLDERWSAQLDGMAITAEAFEGRTSTLITGPVTDQAALYGLLGRLRDLGLALVSVNPVSRAVSG